MDLKPFLVKKTDSIRDALNKIEQNSRGIVFVLDQQEMLVGSITDGDIRRSLLSGKTLQSELAEIMTKNPIFLTRELNEISVKSIFRTSRIRQLPVVDETRRIIDIYFSEDLSTPPKLCAVIMAGGLGKRLRPLTKSLPKPLISLGDQTIIENIIYRLADCGINDIWISLGYKKEKIVDMLNDGSKLNVNINYIEETMPLGTLGALGNVTLPKESTVLIINGDIFSDIDYLALARFHSRHDSDFTVAVHNISHQLQYGVVEIDNHRVLSISEKPEVHFNVNAGIYVVKSEILELIEPGKALNATDFINDILLKRNFKVTPFLITERWIDIGQPSQLHMARKMKDKDNKP